MARADPEAKTTLRLKDILKLANLVVERRNSIPLLGCALIDRQKRQGAFLEVTDLDLTLRLPLPFDLPVGCHAVDLRALSEAVRTLAGDRFGIDDTKVVVGEKPLLVRITTNGDVDGWPARRKIEKPATFKLPAGALATDLAAVRAALSTEEARYYLNGVFVHQVEGNLRFAATDGHRLHRVTRPMPEVSGTMPDAIIPTKAVKLIQSALAVTRFDGDVAFELTRLHLAVRIGDVEIRSRCIDATYPDYSRVVPKSDPKGSTIASVAELTAPALATVSLLSKKGAAVALGLRDCTVRAKSPEGVEVEASFDGHVEGEPAERIGFRAQYLLDALAPFKAVTVRLAAADSASPMAITSDDPHFMAVVMPMRL